MRESIFGPFWMFLFCVAFFSCGEYSTVEEFVQAEKLMQARSDSALMVLESISSPEDMKKADYAYYCLLLTEARDKTYYSFTSDSTIQVALDYYEASGDKLKLPKTYYYMGRVCHTLRNAPQAINYYLKAKDALGKDMDHALEARIYNQLGELYVLLGFNENAIVAYEKAYELLSLAGDSFNLSYALRNTARTYEASGITDSAILYYNKAICSAMETGNVNSLRSSLIELVSIFLRENRLLEAKEYKEKVISLYEGKKKPPQTHLILGKFYDMTEQQDSALYHFNQSINTDNMYTYAASIWQLALLEEKRQNYKQAVYYYHQYIICRDSIEKKMNKTAVSDMEHFYNYQQIENENNRLKIISNRKQLVYSSVSFSVAIFIILIIAYFFYYRQKKEKEILVKEKELSYKEEQYRKSREQVEENLREIQALKEDSEKGYGQFDELTRELLKTKKELLEQQNKQIELSIHHISLQHQKLMESLLYKEVKELVVDKLLLQATWFRFKDEMDTIYEDFEKRLRRLYPLMSEIEIQVCYLIKARFNVSEIAILLGRAKPSITSCRKRLYEKIKGTPGNPEDLDQLIIELS